MADVVVLEPDPPAVANGVHVRGRRPPGPLWRVVVALGAGEARRLLRHGAFVGGLVLVLLLLRATSGPSGPAQDWSQLSSYIALALAPLGWLTLLAANASALRPRRSGTEELLDSLPASPTARTAALCLATLVTVPVTLALLAGWVGWASTWETVGAPRPLEMLVAVPIVAGGGVVGVAVARHLPRPIFGVLAVVAVILIQLNLGNSPTARTRWLVFWVDLTPVELRSLEIRHPGWHLVWLTAWVVVMASVALARHGLRRRPVLGALVAALLVAGLAGRVQTRPLSEDRARELASTLTDPEAHQVCESHGSTVHCAYEEFPGVIAEWRPVVESVLGRVPDPRPDLRVVQRVPTISGNWDCGDEHFLDLVDSRIRAHADPERVWRVDGDVHPTAGRGESLPCGGTDLGWLFTAVQTGAWSVGLPPTPGPGDLRCAADGQARSVVALWLGAQAVRDGADRLRSVAMATALDAARRLDFSGGATPEFDQWNTHPQWGVRWHVDDVEAALELLDRPAEEVGAVVATHWDELIDPATPAARVLELVRGVPGERPTTLPGGGRVGPPVDRCA